VNNLKVIPQEHKGFQDLAKYKDDEIIWNQLMIFLNSSTKVYKVLPYLYSMTVTIVP